MSTLAAIVVLALVDLGAMFVAYRISRTENHADPSDAMPLLPLLGIIVLVLFFHLMATGLLAATVDTSSPGGRLTVFGASSVFGLAPAVVFASFLTKSLSNSATNALFDMKTVIKPEVDCSDAKAAYHRGDVDKALQLFRKHHKENPGVPYPLREADRILEKEQRSAERVEILRRLLAATKHDPAAWAEAAYKLAVIHDQELEDRQAAEFLYREIVKAAPHTTFAEMARAILAER